MASIIKRGKSWRAIVSHGKSRTTKSFKSKAEAKAWSNKIELEYYESGFNHIPDKSFGDALRRYLKEVTPGKGSARTEKLRIESWLGERGNPEPLVYISLRNLQPKHMSDWRDRRMNQVAVGTVLREWNILSAICTKCVKEWGWLKENPFSKVKRPPSPSSRTRRPTVTEIQQLLIVLDYKNGADLSVKRRRVGAAMLFAIETAMRAGEICGLTWNDINFNKRLAFLAKTKNGNSREVPLSRKAIEILQDLQGVEGCSKACFGLNSTSLDALFRKYRDKSLINDLHFHDMRREALTRLAKKLDVMTLAKVSGHRDLKVLQNVYYAPKMEDYAKLLD